MSAIDTLKDLRKQGPLISVGMLTADLLDLGGQIKLAENAGVPLLHVDVMDGRFCPMMTVGPPLIKAMATPMLKDVHLMVEEPLDRLGDFVAAGADLVTIHAESSRYVHRCLQELGQMENVNDASRGIVRGLALNPGTPVEAVEPVLDELEMVFLLAINPGWSGQSFAASTPRRLDKVRELAARHGREDLLIGIDGGIKKGNIADVARMGADIIVTGSAVYDGKTPEENARYMIQAAREAVS
jgi:ribulose-phosphate 3-epimerase